LKQDRMILDTQKCTGCRTCEIACSFHHQGRFRPAVSSIEILERWEELGFTVSFYQKEQGGHRSCDGCRGLPEPLCVKYCNALMREELRALLNISLSHGDDS
jgi:Fe-S-cluster-containing hydrogenase component 2